MASTSTTPMRQRVEEYISKLQDEIVTALEKVDPNAPPFKRDSWVRAQGGRGLSCVFAVPHPTVSEAAAALQNTVLEKGGVNISIVHGTLPPAAVKQMRADHGSMEGLTGNLPFFAAGISLVIHPRNPHSPTVHANYRYFEITEPSAESPEEEHAQGKVVAWWFGGGSDLTPSYLYEEDALHWHKTLKDACASHGTVVYPTFKKWCDEYFFIKHRGEARGIGGMFFDDVCDEPHKRFLAEGSDADSQRPRTPDDIFAMIKSLGDAFVPSFVPILERRMKTPYDDRQRRWQLLRRGRYVEFNLVYDRGTLFGMLTPGARIESVLMSLPETARWEYMSDLGTDGDASEEGKLVEVLKTPREWV
ncbi:coproporphyrinogen III oxidase [Laetiporus sulphureus 93-53]|uniref:coproporphyrinogen oxidase n=1 Tax=Laetiporus sulphureus 93-53 TaxID=1314785 RepID=A0A165HVI6_9APHY|nr:coproporphyrinogen III oxidase [Laetiporus sulphureus 93-53]KZT12245.1 coproporphyrinogen III oxidase [Laetiporus sulphureus 93-53]